MKQSVVRNFLVMMTVSLLVVVSLYLLSFQLWNRSIISVGFESLVATISALCVASLATQHNKTRKRSFAFLTASFIYFTLIEMGGAIEKQIVALSPMVQKTFFVLVSDILEIAILGALLLTGILFEVRGDEFSNQKAYYTEMLLVLIVALGIHGLARLLILPNLNVELSLLAATFFAASAVGIFSASSFMLIRAHRLFENIGTMRTVGAMILLMLSVLTSWLAIYSNSTIWILSSCLQIVAIFTFYIGFTVPYLRKFNADDSKNGEIFGYSVAFVIIFLLFITMLAEIGWPSLMQIDFGVVTLARFGSTAMLITITVFTLKFANMTENRFLYPLLMIYAVWIANGITQLGFSLILSSSHVESLVSHITASLLSIPAFWLSVRWMEKETPSRFMMSPKGWVLAGLALGVSLMALGEAVRLYLIPIATVDLGSIGRSLLLGLCLIAILQLTYISFVRFEKNKGALLLDSLSIAFLSLWFIPSLLKGNFATWTVGWWLSEAVVVIGLFIAPAIMGSMYLELSYRAQQSEIRAKVYADLLAHDISNHHQIILNTIELALMDTTPEFVKEKTLNDAYSTLLDADRLVRNVRKLGSIEGRSKKDLTPFNLMTTISDTFELVTKLYPNQVISMQSSDLTGSCEILANDLLPDVFQNLLLNAIEYSEGGIVELEVKNIEEAEAHYWEVRIGDHGPGIPPEKRNTLFTRYMKGAKGSGLGLSLVQALTEFFNGTIHIEDRVPGNYIQGSCFVLRFPAYSYQE